MTARLTAAQVDAMRDEAEVARLRVLVETARDAYTHGPLVQRQTARDALLAAFDDEEALDGTPEF